MTKATKSRASKYVSTGKGMTITPPKKNTTPKPSFPVKKK